MDLHKIVQEIQYVLAPAIMISSASLLLLGFQNKFSSLTNRFRILNQEKRSLEAKPSRSESEEKRFANLKEQVDGLMQRATHVKNAIILTYGAIVSFIATSVLLFLNIYTPLHSIALTIACFLIGLLLIFASSALMMIEVALAFKIVSLEHRL